jgi:aminoglycoside 6'-N-acetyltransferase
MAAVLCLPIPDIVVCRSTMSPYRFRPFSRDDIPMIGRWVRTPEAMRWWGEPAEQLALVAGDLDEPLMRQWIVECRGRPFAYAQAYPVDAWPQPHFTGLPAGTVAVDTFIGVPEMIGCGHGGAFLRAFAAMLIAAGARAVAIDPDAANMRARRAYARAGFVERGEAKTDAGPVIVMLFRRDARPGVMC